MKNYTHLIFSFLVISFGIGLSFLNVLDVQAQVVLKYPISELGNCQDKNACWQYCSVSSHYLACTDFGEKNNLISKEDAARAKEFVNVLKGQGPGSCKDEAACKNYCNNISNINECVTFAEKHNLMSTKQLNEAKQVAKALKEGAALPGGCDSKESCESYCNKKENQKECLAFAKDAGLFFADKTKEIEEALKQAPPAAQKCVKSMMNNISEKMKSGELKGESDIQAIIQGCLPPGTKIPSGGWMNMEFLKKIQEFYGKNLSPQDLESLKKAQEQLKGIIPPGTEIPSGNAPFNLEDVKKIQEKMQEEYKKLTPEELEYIKKTQEQGQYENIAPPEIPGDNSGMGM